jgi:hypothetical protein
MGVSQKLGWDQARDGDSGVDGHRCNQAITAADHKLGRFVRHLRSTREPYDDGVIAAAEEEDRGRGLHVGWGNSQEESALHPGRHKFNVSHLGRTWEQESIKKWVLDRHQAFRTDCRSTVTLLRHLHDINRFRDNSP